MDTIFSAPEKIEKGKRKNTTGQPGEMSEQDNWYEFEKVISLAKQVV